MTTRTRQRTAPPMDRWTARRGPSSGGTDFMAPRTLAPGIDDERDRYYGATFDGQLLRDRGPWYQRPTYTGAAQSWVNWTQAGPLRPELHMRNATWREESGSSVSRFPYIEGAPTGGMHTMGVAGVARTRLRYQQTPQMVGVRRDRLSPGQYSGQTYSQTTTLQGGRVR